MSSSGILERIVESQRRRVAQGKATLPLVDLRARATEVQPRGDFLRTLGGDAGSHCVRVMAELKRSFSTTLVLVTHDPAAAALADRHLHLHAGRLVDGRATG